MTLSVTLRQLQYSPLLRQPFESTRSGIYTIDITFLGPNIVVFNGRSVLIGEGYCYCFGLVRKIPLVCGFDLHLFCFSLIFDIILRRASLSYVFQIP